MKALNNRWRRWLGTGIFAAVLLIAAVVFRAQLVAWFGDPQALGPAAEASASSASTLASKVPHVPTPSLAYPPAAFDALRTVLDAVEHTRATLAGDQVSGVADAGRAIAEGLRAAAADASKARSDVGDALGQAAAEADKLAAAPSLEEARKAFAALNRDLVPLVGTDARLTKDLHVFECPMFDHARWLQRTGKADNPYMGTKMLTCGNASSFESALGTPATATSSASPGEIDHYTCSMHPSVKQQTPGKCPICGMDLIPVTKEQQEQGVVMIDDARRQLIGVRTGIVIQGPMQRTFRAIGQITYDESAITDVNLKVRGWITKLFVSQTGQHVSRGQPLFLLYSPDLYSAEQDFLLANQGNALATGSAGATSSRMEMLNRAARQRLHLLGLTEPQIDDVAKKGVPSESIAISSPATGFVIEKNVVDGASVDPGMRLYRIAALNKVWVEAEVYEADLPHVRVGQAANVALDYLPGHSYDAKIAYIYPYVDATARTGRVRVELANKQLELRPGMYASVTLASDAVPRVQVPAAAVVYTGPRRLVFVDLGAGRFRPQEVKVGTEANGMYEVLSGLAPGDRVATSGVFLIAAEARISTATKYWDKTPDDSAAVDLPGLRPSEPEQPEPVPGGK